MDCEKFDRVTMELLYGELDELSEAAAHRHLHHCTRCRDIWGHLRTTRELAEIPLEEPPDDLFESVLLAEANAQKSLPVSERFSRAISVMAGYAMRPQLAMAALLLLMIGSSLVFVRTDPANRGQVSVTELGTPNGEPGNKRERGQEPLVFDGAPAAQTEDAEDSPHARQLAKLETADDAPTAKSTRGAAAGGQTYSDAMSAYQEGRYAEAERLFSEVASSGDERAASAALHEGHAARNGSGCQRAAALYDSVAARYAGGTVADEASWHAASCYRAMGQLKRASAHYTALKERPAYASRASTALDEITAQLAVASKDSTETAAPASGAGKAKSAAAPVADAAAAAAPPAEPKAKPVAAPAPAAKPTESAPVAN